MRSHQTISYYEYGKWISVKDEFPEFNVRVLVVNINDPPYHPKIAEYYDNTSIGNKNEWYSDNGECDTTHWMPLPEPPKER